MSVPRRKRKSNVVSLWGSATPLPQVVPDVVEKLTELLDLARAGQIVGLAYVRVTCEGHHSRGWVGIAQKDFLVSGVGMLNQEVLLAAVACDTADN